MTATKVRKSDINPLPEYFDRYINRVDDAELLSAFDESVRQIEALDKNLLAHIGDKKYAPGKWTVKEILQHLIDWERILSFRALLFARCENSVLQNIDENSLAENMNVERRTIDELIAELKIARLSTKSMFASFADEILLKTGTNWKYEISVLAMGFTIIGHQDHHFHIIEERYLPLAD